MDYVTLAEEATLNSAKDVFYHPLYTKRMVHSTVSRIARGQWLPPYATMRRLVVYALGLTEAQCLWLESLRQQENYIHHTTNPQFAIVKKEASRPKQVSQRAQVQDVPDWVHCQESD